MSDTKVIHSSDTSGHIFSLFLKYVSANVLGMIGFSCYILADTFFIARGIGSDALAALNLVLPAYSLLNGTGLMIGMGGGSRYSLSSTHPEGETHRTVFTQSVLLAVIAAIFFALTGLLGAEPLCLLLGADSRTLPFAVPYIRILLDYLFIYPLNLGMVGAALATATAPLISMGILSTHFLRGNSHFRLMKTKPSLSTASSICSLGVSSLITEVSSGIVILVFNFLILDLSGNTGVAAYGVLANIALVLIAISTGIAQGIQPIVSSHPGKKGQPVRHQIRCYALLTALLLALLSYAVIFLLADPIADLFNKDQNTALTSIAADGMRIYFTSLFFSGINIVAAVFLSSTDHPKQAFILSLLRGFLLIIPAAFLLAHLFGLTGIWMSLPVTEGIVCIFSLLFLKKV
ncbi:MATE family efflux transporter [[Ruminococcus] lactaris]|uniref:MATE family efflux transporter n=1 Tax=[Ruminococcus] lactaris TaxID=46228 RepID=UPI0022E71C41|nr:MATE family efflux transporter [[Ruminococcus] lactaris]